MKAKPNNASDVNVAKMEAIYEDVADLEEVGEVMKMDDNDAYARPPWMHY